MEIEGPRQRTDGRWEMTFSNSTAVLRPLGYCKGWTEHTRESITNTPGWGAEWADQVLAEQEATRPFRAKYHTDGHATARDALECYRSYQLDHELVHSVDADCQRHCAVCGAWTQLRTRVNGAAKVTLCAEHRSVSHIRTALGWGPAPAVVEAPPVEL